MILLKYLEVKSEEEASSLNGGRNMKSKIVEFVKDENGQTSTEYVLLVAVVAFIIIKLKGQLSEGLEKIVGSVFTKATGFLEDLK